jgi:hypothetical protein
MTRHTAVLEEVLPEYDCCGRHDGDVAAGPKAPWWAVERFRPEEPVQ